MSGDGWVFIISGVVFLFLGVGANIWGRLEEKSYYDSMPSRRVDVREYLERLPYRPEPGALNIGGWITIAIGILLLLVGVVVGLWHPQ